MAVNAASTTVPLATPLQTSALSLDTRVVLSAMTRLRVDPVTNAPTDLVAEYYAQRTSPGGLLITECAAIAPGATGYVRAPDMFSPECFEGWKKVTSAVHAKGGVIFAQLFHAGHVPHPCLLLEGTPLVAPSAIATAGPLEPTTLAEEQIKTIVKDFGTAAKNAVAAGFDGIEIHAGNGYLVQQFMALKTNQRTDSYGGSLENRMRFLLEVMDACAEAIGPSKVSVKLQPDVTLSGITEPTADVAAQLKYLAPLMSSKSLAYVCLAPVNAEPYFRHLGLDKPKGSFDPFVTFRGNGFTGTLMINGRLDVESGNDYVGKGVADLVAYGKFFLANPTLPALVAAGWGTGQLNMGGFDVKVWYGGNPADDAKGFTDWPLTAP